jgi:hypothetical protein
MGCMFEGAIASGLLSLLGTLRDFCAAAASDAADKFAEMKQAIAAFDGKSSENAER